MSIKNFVVTLTRSINDLDEASALKQFESQLKDGLHNTDIVIIEDWTPLTEINDTKPKK